MTVSRRAVPSIKIITPPEFEQITLEEARRQLSLGDDGDCPPSHPLDPLISEKIAAAREYCEDYLGLALTPRVIEMAIDAFADSIELPLPPVTSIVSVIYADTDGASQALDGALYLLDDYQQPAWLLPAYGTSWPATYAVPNAVKVRLNVGYSLRGDSPETHPLPHKFYQAMMLLMTDMVINRSATAGEEARKAAENLMQLGSVRMRV